MKVRLSGIAALLLNLLAAMQVVAWIGGGHGGQAFYACLAAMYATLLWRDECNKGSRA